MVLTSAAAAAAEGEKAFEWEEPDVDGGVFTDELGMLDREREQYAGNLAAYAVNLVAREEASAASLETARRLLGLSRHLASRNRRALVAENQLSRGVVPEPVERGYSDEVLARLMLTRARALEQQGGDENRFLARIFTELAAELDPKNQDAVYASEIHRIDHGRVDWSRLTDTPEDGGAADGDDRP